MALDVSPLMQAIDRYLEKADSDLEETLEAEGFVDAADAVEAAGRIEDAVTEATQDYVDDVLKKISTRKGLEEYVAAASPGYDTLQDLEDDLKAIFRNEFDRMVRQFSFSYLVAQDPGLPAPDRSIARQTQDQINQWSRTLAAATTKWVEPEIMDMIRNAVDEGNDIDGVTKVLLDSGVRDTEWKARRLALTEVLRMQSMGQQDAFIQDPACYKKRWVYTWQAKEPRNNHIDMDGQEVFKRETFTLLGADGGLYHPLFPRDVSLPASESVNCHCAMKAVTDEKVLGMDADERAELRRKALEEADAEWQEEHAHDNVDMYKSLSEDEKDFYFGGMKKAGPYRALLDSGVITTDEEFARLYGRDASGRRYLKSPEELAKDGIFTISNDVLKDVDRSGFPEDWDEEKIRNAGTFVANRYAVSENATASSQKLFVNYDGVTVGVSIDEKRNVKNVFYDEQQRLVEEVSEATPQTNSRTVSYLDGMTESRLSATRNNGARKRVDGAENYVAEHLGVSKEEAGRLMDEGLQTLVDNSEFAIRINSENLSGVLEDGYFRNIHENSPEGVDWVRAQKENQLFGVPMDADNADRPVYGFLIPTFDASNSSIIDYYADGPGSQYGGIVVILDKEAVINNASITLGDSLDYAGMLVGTEANKPTFAGSCQGSKIALPIAKLPGADKEKVAETLIDITTLNRGAEDDRYVEVQLHGRESHSVGNISRVYIPEKEVTSGNADALIKKLDDMAISHGMISDSKRFTTSDVNDIVIESKQFGKKAGKHAGDWGLDPGDPESRKKYEEITRDIIANHDEVRHGEWRGQAEICDFYIKGKDVVVVNSGKYVTTLKDGVDNERIKNAGK